MMFRAIWFVFLCGFVTPWVLSLFIVKRKEWLTVFVMAPFASIMGMTLDRMWFHLGYGAFHPNPTSSMDAIPCELGVFPVFVSIFVIFTERYRRKWLFLCIFTTIVTLWEGFGILIGVVEYKNGWNLFETYVTYFVGFWVSFYWYELWLRLRQYVESGEELEVKS